MRLLNWLGLFLLPLLAGCAAVSSQQPAAAVGPTSLQPSDQPFRRGVNVLGYDPYWTDAGKRRHRGAAAGRDGSLAGGP